MFKQILVAAAITLASVSPVSAGVGDVFDSRNDSPAGSGGCFETNGGHGVCWQKLNAPNTYSLSLREVHNSPAFATTIYLQCGNSWEAFGPADKSNLQQLVDSFCENI